MYTYTRPPQANGGGGKTHHKPPPQATGVGEGKEERVDNLKGKKDHDHPEGGLATLHHTYIYIYIYIYLFISFISLSLSIYIYIVTYFSDYMTKLKHEYQSLLGGLQQEPRISRYFLEYQFKYISLKTNQLGFYWYLQRTTVWTLCHLGLSWTGIGILHPLNHHLCK